MFQPEPAFTVFNDQRFNSVVLAERGGMVLITAWDYDTNQHVYFVARTLEGASWTFHCWIVMVEFYAHADYELALEAYMYMSSPVMA